MLIAGKRYRSWIRVGNMKKAKRIINAAKNISHRSDDDDADDLFHRLFITYIVKTENAANRTQPKMNKLPSGRHIPCIRPQVLKALIDV
jgi:hypothetical protein